jgi:DNA-binding MarR family transcriptional regulator/GNAT superfamily N-acetyltransferase
MGGSWSMPNPSPLPSESPGETARFRRFNRMYTRYIGTLDEGFLNSQFSLAEGRILYELANRATPTASVIAAELGIDAGYLSRVVRKFGQQGLLSKRASARDRRSATLRLTARGRSAFTKLSARSEEQAERILAALTPVSRIELLRSMQSIENILSQPARRRSFVLRPHRVGDMGWVVYSEAVGYAKQYGWDTTFEALVAKIVADFITNYDASRERCWIAEIEGEHVGHIFLVKHPDEPRTAKLRLLFVEPCARGMGLGAALVSECLRFARTAGYQKIVLWTQSMLGAAHRIYEQAGFRLVKEEPHRSFGHDLIGQEWEFEFS